MKTNNEQFEPLLKDKKMRLLKAKEWDQKNGI